MLDGDTFDALEFVARELRKDPAPFGGVRLVLSGDFFQVRDRGQGWHREERFVVARYAFSFGFSHFFVFSRVWGIDWRGTMHNSLLKLKAVGIVCGRLDAG